jgi:hypothetical protein
MMMLGRANRAREEALERFVRVLTVLLFTSGVESMDGLLVQFWLYVEVNQPTSFASQH